MLSSVLKNDRANKINAMIMRAFVQPRSIPQPQPDMSKRLNELEQTLLDAIQQSSVNRSLSQTPAFFTTSIHGSGAYIHFTEVNPKPSLQLEYIPIKKKDVSKIEIINQTVAEHFGLQVLDLKTVSRNRKYVLPRQIAIYLIRKYTDLGYKEIAGIFGKKDHTTAHHACQKILSDIAKRDATCEAVEAIQEAIPIALRTEF